MSTAILSENPRERIGANNPPLTLAETIEQLDATLPRDHADFLANIEAIASRANAWLPKSDKALGAGGLSIKGGADVEKVKAIILDAKGASRAVGEAHKRVKEPFLKGGRIVDAFFRKIDERVDRITAYLDGCIRKYQDEQEQAERLRRAEEERKRLAEEERQREIARRAEEEGRAAVAAKALQKADNAAAAAEEARAAQQQASEARTAGDAFAGVSSTKTWTFEITDAPKIDLNKLRAHIPLADIEKALRGYVRANKGTAPLDGVRFFETNANRYRA